MPELPEVETIARGLRASVVGRSIVDFSTRQPKAINLPLDDFRERTRQAIRGVDRLGKSAILRLDHGAIWLHMGLSGQALVDDRDRPTPESEPIALFRLDDGSRIRLERLFMGHAHYLTAEESAGRARKLGTDALSPEFTSARLGEMLSAKPNLSLKALLLDQSLLCGVGNVYSDEALHRAGLHPERKAASLGAEEVRRLHHALRSTLEASIALGGDESYSDVGGQPGRYTSRIHARKTCTACGGPAEKRSLGGRTAYFCPQCQR